MKLKISRILLTLLFTLLLTFTVESKVSAATITNLSASSVTSATFDLSWTCEYTYADYNVYINGVFKKAVYDMMSTNITGLNPSTTYNVRVAVRLSNGNDSPAQSTISVTTLAATPPIPTGLWAHGMTSTSTILDWNASSGATSYKVYVNGSLYSTTASTTMTISGLSGGTTYTLSVAAVNASGTSAQSSGLPSTTIPLAPTGLSATAASSSQINLSWTGSTGATSYSVYTSSGTYVASTTSTSYQVTGLSANTYYAYYIKAYNIAGYSSASSSAGTTTYSTAPSAPTGLSATAASPSQINLSWNGSSGATGYYVYRSGSYVTSTSSTYYNNTGLSASTYYSYNVYAYNSAGTSAASSTAGATTWAPAPSAPTGLSATAASPSQINLSWNGSSGATSYYVYTSSGTYVTATSSTSYQVTGLSASTYYAYYVYAYNSAGYSAASSTTGATTWATAPSAPTGLSATAASPSQINLSWNGSSGATGYYVYRSGSYLTATSSTYYNNTGLSASTYYSYNVYAYNSAGTSAASSTAGATTWAPPVTIPSAPTGLSAIAASQSQINLSWTGVTGATSYKVYRGVTLISSPTTTSYSNTGLTANTSYSYTVKASNSAGDSAASSTATATTWPTVPSAPTGLSATAESPSQINLSWTGVTGATSYKVYRGVTFISSPTTTSYSNTGLTANTSYSYTVKASNSAGDSAASSTASATTLGIIPTITSQSAASSSGNWNYGDSAIVNASGTNISSASVKIFYAMGSTAPIIPGEKGDPIADGWSDSNKSYDIPTVSGNTIAQAIPSTDIGEWNYLMFKVWAQSSTEDQTWNFTSAYMINNLPQPEVDMLIGDVATNQVVVGTYSKLETTGSNRNGMPVSDPYTPTEPYNSTDETELRAHYPYQNGDVVKYRLEFNATDATKIKDIKAILYLNSYNEEGVKVSLTSAKLYKGTLKSSTAYPGNTYQSYALIKNLLYSGQGRKNRYTISLGNDNSGNPIIQANGNARYAIELIATLTINQVPGELTPLDLMNEVQIQVYIGGGSYAKMLDPDLPSNKTYIVTKATRINAILR